MGNLVRNVVGGLEVIAFNQDTIDVNLGPDASSRQRRQAALYAALAQIA